MQRRFSSAGSALIKPPALVNSPSCPMITCFTICGWLIHYLWLAGSLFIGAYLLLFKADALSNNTLFSSTPFSLTSVLNVTNVF